MYLGKFRNKCRYLWYQLCFKWLVDAHETKHTPCFCTFFFVLEGSRWTHMHFCFHSPQLRLKVWGGVPSEMLVQLMSCLWSLHIGHLGPLSFFFSRVCSGADIQPSFFFLGLGSWPTHHNTPQSLYVMSRSGHKMPGVARVSRKVQTFTQCAFSHSWFFFSLFLWSHVCIFKH